MSELVNKELTTHTKQELSSSSKADLKTEQYLTFMMADDEYGIDILSVQEIHGWFEARPIPNTPDYLKGVIDWRGIIVPIVDLRLRFEYKHVAYTKTTVVIILKTVIESISESVTVGIIVDAVSDVHDITPESIREIPCLGSKVDIQYIKAIAKVEDKMIVLLELSKLINLRDLSKK